MSFQIENIISFLSDILIIFKLIIYILYTSILVLVNNLVTPRCLLTKSIKGKVVLITGAAGGIGQYLVISMLNQGCQVCCLDNCQQALKKLETKISQMNLLNKKVFCYKIDVTSVEQIDDCARDITEKIGPVDIIINAAGVFNKGKLFVELSEKDMQNIFNVNILSQMYVCRRFLPEMIARDSGHIVNMCSSLGQFGAYRVTDYCATKYAVNGFTDALRVELKSMKSRIKVTLVCPYHINTDFFKGFKMNKFHWAKVAHNDPKDVVNSITQGIMQSKELIGYPKVQFFVFLAIKNLITTYASDHMMIWFGFNEGIDNTKNSFTKTQ